MGALGTEGIYMLLRMVGGKRRQGKNTNTDISS